MEGVEVKETAQVEEKKPAKKARKKKMKNSAEVVKFMEDRNAKRKRANLPMAYAQEEIDALK